MSNIWSAVIPESKKAVDKYLKEIMADLIENLNSGMWRNRQSRYTHVTAMHTMSADIIIYRFGLF